MRRFHRILAVAAFGAAVSGLIAAPAAAAHDYHGTDPDGTRVTSVDPDGHPWGGGTAPDGPDGWAPGGGDHFPYN
jgi:hypothetical protein